MDNRSTLQYAICIVNLVAAAYFGYNAAETGVMLTWALTGALVLAGVGNLYLARKGQA